MSPLPRFSETFNPFEAASSPRGLVDPSPPRRARHSPPRTPASLDAASKRIAEKKRRDLIKSAERGRAKLRQTGERSSLFRPGSPSFMSVSRSALMKSPAGAGSTAAKWARSDPGPGRSRSQARRAVECDGYGDRLPVGEVANRVQNSKLREEVNALRRQAAGLEGELAAAREGGGGGGGGGGSTPKPSPKPSPERPQPSPEPKAQGSPSPKQPSPNKTPPSKSPGPDGKGSEGKGSGGKGSGAAEESYTTPDAPRSSGSGQGQGSGQGSGGKGSAKGSEGKGSGKGPEPGGSGGSGAGAAGGDGAEKGAAASPPPVAKGKSAGRKKLNSMFGAMPSRNSLLKAAGAAASVVKGGGDKGGSPGSGGKGKGGKPHMSTAGSPGGEAERTLEGLQAKLESGKLLSGEEKETLARLTAEAEGKGEGKGGEGGTPRGKKGKGKGKGSPRSEGKASGDKGAGGEAAAAEGKEGEEAKPPPPPPPARVRVQMEARKGRHGNLSVSVKVSAETVAAAKARAAAEAAAAEAAAAEAARAAEEEAAKRRECRSAVIVYGSAASKVSASLADRSGGTLITIDTLSAWAAKDPSRAGIEGLQLQNAVDSGAAVPAFKEVVLPVLLRLMENSPPPYLLIDFPKVLMHVRLLQDAASRIALAIAAGPVLEAADKSLDRFFERQEGTRNHTMGFGGEAAIRRSIKAMLEALPEGCFKPKASEKTAADDVAKAVRVKAAIDRAARRFALPVRPVPRDAEGWAA